MVQQRGFLIVGATAALSVVLASLRGVTPHDGLKISVDFSSSARSLAQASCARDLDAEGICALRSDGLPLIPMPEPGLVLYPVELNDGAVLLVHQFLDRPALKARVAAAGVKATLEFRCDATLLGHATNVRVRTQHSESYALVRSAWHASLGACEIR